MAAKVVMKAVKMWNKRFCCARLVEDITHKLKDHNAYDWDTEGHHVEGKGGDDHDHEDGPVEISSQSK